MSPTSSQISRPDTFVDYQFSDFASKLGLIRKEEIADDEKQWQEEDLVHVQRFCTNNIRCRRQQVLAYFSETFDARDCNQMCDNCRDTTPITRVDHTQEAHIALEYLEEVCRRKMLMTRQQFRDALRGSKQKAILDKGFNGVPHYGALKHLQIIVVDRIVDVMLGEQIVDPFVQLRAEYNQTYVKVKVPAAF